MEKRKQSDIDKIIRLFLEQIPKRNQTVAAKILAISKQRFNDYYNHRYNPPEELLMAMVQFLAERGIDLTKNKKSQSKNNTTELSILERAEQGLAIEMQCLERRGRVPNEKKQKKNLKWQNSATLNFPTGIGQRTSEWVAEQCGFSNRNDYREAKHVLLSGSIELKQATNTGKIRIDQAYQLLKLPESEQHDLLTKNQEGSIDDAIAAIRSLSNPIKAPSALYSDLVKKELQTQLPLFRVLTGLRMHSHKSGYFDWQLKPLRDWILPEVSEADFAHIMELLCECRVIQKKQVGQKYVGKILI